MATKPSAALEALAEQLKRNMAPRTAASPITWGDVIIAAEDASKAVADSEYSDYMGQDL